MKPEQPKLSRKEGRLIAGAVEPLDPELAAKFREWTDAWLTEDILAALGLEKVKR